MKTLGLCAILLTMAATASCASPAITLLDTNGAPHSPLDTKTSRAVVLIFIANECPISNSYAPAINRLYTSFAPKGVTFYLVSTDTAASVAATMQHAKAFALRPPVLLDKERALVKYVGATVTPEAYLFTPNGTLAYRGRLDNRYLELGKMRPAATVFDLQAALTAVLAGKPVATARTKAVGCFL